MSELPYVEIENERRKFDSANLGADIARRQEELETFDKASLGYFVHAQKITEITAQKAELDALIASKEPKPAPSAEVETAHSPS